MIKKVYILLCDDDGNTLSQTKPIGVAVTSKEEAEKFLKLGYSYKDDYMEVDVFDTLDEAIEFDREG